MIIRTATELVRYIQHQLAGSEHQDVLAVEEFVDMRTKQLRDRILALEEQVDRLTDPEERPVDIEMDREREETESE